MGSKILKQHKKQLGTFEINLCITSECCPYLKAGKGLNWCTRGAAVTLPYLEERLDPKELEKLVEELLRI